MRKDTEQAEQKQNKAKQRDKRPKEQKRKLFAEKQAERKRAKAHHEKTRKPRGKLRTGRQIRGGAGTSGECMGVRCLRPQKRNRHQKIFCVFGLVKMDGRKQRKP